MSRTCPLISVIMAAYNAEATLAAAVASVLAQEIQDFELVVVDDLSTDGTYDLAGQLAAQDGRIKLLQAARNGGPAAARNLGLAAARGEWVAIVDSDDTILPDRFSRLLDAATDRKADIVFDNLFWTDRKTGAARKTYIPHHLHLGGDISFDLFLRSHRLIHPVPNLGFLKPLIRRELLERHHLRYEEKLKIGEDAYLIVELMAAGARAVFLPYAGYHYERRGGSISAKQTPDSIRSVIAAYAALLDRSDVTLSPPVVKTLRLLMRDQENRLLTRHVAENFPSLEALRYLPRILTDRNAAKWLWLDTGSRVRKYLKTRN